MHPATQTRDDIEYHEAMQTLSVLEGVATADAAARLSPFDIARARDLNGRLMDALGSYDAETFALLNRAFHGVLFERCSNASLRALIETLWRRIDEFDDDSFALPLLRAEEAVAEHEELLALIEERAHPLRIELAARVHLMGALD
ncbi:MAG: GntR family transcriptional regulator [Subtercola sp.]|nr:GntR family transcriptional regulator [Subtercola sp.]